MVQWPGHNVLFGVSVMYVVYVAKCRILSIRPLSYEEKKRANTIEKNYYSCNKNVRQQKQ